MLRSSEVFRQRRLVDGVIIDGPGTSSCPRRPFYIEHRLFFTGREWFIVLVECSTILIRFDIILFLILLLVILTYFLAPL
jgi:hypothetical protein